MRRGRLMKLAWNEDFGADAVAYEIESELKKLGIHKVSVKGDYDHATVTYSFRQNVEDYIYCKLRDDTEVELGVDSNGDGSADEIDYVLGKLTDKTFESYKRNELGWVKEIAKTLTPIIHEALTLSKKKVSSLKSRR